MSWPRHDVGGLDGGGGVVDIFGGGDGDSVSAYGRGMVDDSDSISVASQDDTAR